MPLEKARNSERTSQERSQLNSQPGPENLSQRSSQQAGQSDSEHQSQRNIFILRAAIIVTMIFAAAVLRILPHPWNFTPVGAMAIFSGALFRNRWAGFLLPLACLLAGDLFIGFHSLMLIVYLSFAISVTIGHWMAKSRTVARLGGAVFVGALQFFIVTNFAMWAIGGFYPRTMAGLAQCFAAAVPFFWNTLAGDFLYSAVLFGGFALVEKLFSLRDFPGERAGTALS